MGMKIVSSNNFTFVACNLLALLFLVVNLKAQDRQMVEESTRINAQSAYIDGLAAFENEDYQHALDLLKAAYVKLPDHPGVNYALADAYLMMNDVTNAEYYGKQAVKLAPRNPWYRLKLARLYRDQGKNKTAVTELTDALEYNPHNETLLHELAQSYSDLGQLNEANKVYNKLLFLKGEDLNVRLERLRNFNDLGMQDSAITELKKIRDLNPNNIATLRVLSNHYKMIGQMAEAKEVLNNALQINERDSKTLLMLSNIYIEQAQWDSLSTFLSNTIADSLIATSTKINLAKYLYSNYKNDRKNRELQKTTATVLKKLMYSEPNSGSAQSLAADFFTQTGQTELALQAYEKATELAPTNGTAWQKRLQLLLRKGEIKKAIAIGEEATKAVPQEPIILYFLGSAHLSDQNYQEAITYLDKAKELPIRRSLKANILGALANTYAALKQWNKAFPHYEKALKIQPKNPGFLNNYAYYLSLQKRKLDQARKMAQKAIKIAPNNPSYLDTLGWIYFQQGEYKKAEEYIRASLDTGQASAEVMEHMGDVLQKLGKLSQARQWWQKAFNKDSTRTHLKDKIPANGE
ncbi:tetratricopeptide repeat protein [Fodinibius halophilus]|uniref:Tetratricopeptide repeat protein n=1 Tax=Fodinibius halophilus TaxID=1736908 RepID=A0A6M1TL00_9BACT|nr:tetratricopeptide repeat protein [Fodinibius halophilus]NGP89150.1 tetratricopeptide repeat protein [Fodinibius halophilus]